MSVVLQNWRAMHLSTRHCRSTLGSVSLAALLLSALGTGSAHAALGGDLTSVTADAQSLHGTLRTASMPAYEVHEISGDNGLRVRELANRDGVVFAVLWNGPAMPDLRLLLGANFQDFSAAVAAQRPAARRSLKVELPHLVVESGGHMRAYDGRAYLPALIPTGTSPADIR